jgi:indole-3-acetate monooxygenase
VNTIPGSPGTAVATELQADMLIRRARDLAPMIYNCRDEIDTARQLPEKIVQALRAAGIFRLFAPARFGGYEVDPITFIKVVEEISAADGSAGWIAAVCNVGGLFAGYMGEKAVMTIHGENPDVIVAGGINPTGKALAVDGGYLIQGRWSYGSGIRHADWVYGSCVIHDGGQVRLDSAGKPEIRLMLFPATACVVHDTWSVGGLRGTGSDDFSVSDLFVSSDRSLIAFAGQATQPGILFRFPFSLFAALIAAVPLGIARGAISALVELAKSKKPTGANVLLCEKSSAQIAVARAEALVRSGRAFLFEALTEMRSEIVESGEAGMRTRALLRIACTQAAMNAAQAVDLMFEAGGATSVYTSSPLERCFRDVRVALQHIAVSPAYFELSGRALLGLDPGTARF